MLNQGEIFSQQGSCTRSQESQLQRRKIMKLIISVTVMFAVSWLPIQIILLVKSFYLLEVTIFQVSLQISSHVLAYSNSCVNPILYALLSTPFKTEFKRLLACICKTQSSSPLLQNRRYGYGTWNNMKKIFCLINQRSLRRSRRVQTGDNDNENIRLEQRSPLEQDL